MAPSERLTTNPLAGGFNLQDFFHPLTPRAGIRRISGRRSGAELAFPLTGAEGGERRATPAFIVDHLLGGLGEDLEATLLLELCALGRWLGPWACSSCSLR